MGFTSVSRAYDASTAMTHLQHFVAKSACVHVHVYLNLRFKALYSYLLPMGDEKVGRKKLYITMFGKKLYITMKREPYLLLTIPTKKFNFH